MESVSFCGLDDLTEIFYLSLQEAGLGLGAVMEIRETDERFLDRPVVELAEGVNACSGPIILTALQRAGELKRELLRLGADEARIFGPALSFDEILGQGGKGGRR